MDSPFYFKDMKKNEEYTITVEAYTVEGLALAKINEFVLFIPGLIKGEVARVSLTKVKKNYAYARVIEILEPSKERVQPDCSISRICGGCQLQFMSYAEQLALKQEIVLNHCLKHNIDSKWIQPILPSPNQDRYRNKVQVPIQEKNGKTLVGFYRTHSHDVVVYEDCLVQTKESNQVTKLLQEYLQTHHLTSLFRYIFIRHTHQKNELMVMPIVRHISLQEAKKLGQFLKERVENITSFSFLVNNSETNVILDGPIYPVFGPSFLQESLMGMEFQLSAKAFFQVNPYSTEVLYSKAIELAELSKEEILVDLYCGTGTIGILASPKVKKVIGIEIVPEVFTLHQFTTTNITYPFNT